VAAGTPENPNAVWFAKILAVVAPDATVTVTVAGPARAYAALYYHGHEPPRSVRDGTAEQVFVGCPAASYADGTQFNGGFVVQGRRCVPVDVKVGAEPAARAIFSLGAGRC
jgi:hypothetical protein